MAKFQRLFRPVLFGAFFAAPVALFAAVIGERPDAAAVPVAGAPLGAVAASSAKTIAPQKDQKEEPARNVDSMVTDILERPLFNASRQGVRKSNSSDVAKEAPPPPQLPERLAGMIIRPEGRQALFENQGQKPIAVNEGQQIDGWTVASIRADHVILRSATGEQVMKPANSTRPTPVLTAQNRQPLTARKKQNAAPRNAAKTQPIPAVAPQTQRPGQNNLPGR